MYESLPEQTMLPGGDQYNVYESFDVRSLNIVGVEFNVQSVSAIKVAPASIIFWTSPQTTSRLAGRVVLFPRVPSHTTWLVGRSEEMYMKAEKSCTRNRV
jgi:hypothetical protein